MTIKERLISLLGFAAEDNTLEGALIDEGLTGSDTYTSSFTLNVKKCALTILETLLSTADTTNGIPASFGIRYDRDAIAKRIQALKEDLGLITAPAIRARSPW